MKNVDENKLIITPLGAGLEVGRSCIVMSYKGKNVMVDLYIYRKSKNFLLVRLWSPYEVYRARVITFF